MKIKDLLVIIAILIFVVIPIFYSDYTKVTSGIFIVIAVAFFANLDTGKKWWGFALDKKSTVDDLLSVPQKVGKK